MRANELATPPKECRRKTLSLTIPTIAAPCAGRTVSSVVAIWACLGGEGPGRKGSRQFQRGFEAAGYSLSHKAGIRRRGLEA